MARSGAVSHPALVDRIAQLARRNRRAVTWTVALFPLAFVLLMTIGKLLVPGAYAYLIAEDNVVEYATCFTYLLASGFAAALALDLRRNDTRLHASLYWLFSFGDCCKTLAVVGRM